MIPPPKKKHNGPVGKQNSDIVKIKKLKNRRLETRIVMAIFYNRMNAINDSFNNKKTRIVL